MLGVRCESNARAGRRVPRLHNSSPALALAPYYMIVRYDYECIYTGRALITYSICIYRNDKQVGILLNAQRIGTVKAEVARRAADHISNVEFQSAIWIVGEPQ